MSETADRALADAMINMFSADEMRRLIQFSSYGSSLAQDLPGANASTAQVAHAIVTGVRKRGATDQLLQQLRDARPLRRAEIDRIATLASAPQAMTTMQALEEAAPLRFNARWLIHIQCTQEQTLDLHATFGATHRQTTDTKQLQDMLWEHNPHLLHLEGSAQTDAQNFMLTRNGRSVNLTAELFGRILGVATKRAPHLKGVVLHNCYPAAKVGFLKQQIGFVVTLQTPDQDMARLFIETFYTRLFEGAQLQVAYEEACIELQFAGIDPGTHAGLATNQGDISLPAV